MKDIDKDTCIMKVEDGKFFLYTPKGEKLEFQKNAVVIQPLEYAHNNIALARITLFVRLEDSK